MSKVKDIIDKFDELQLEKSKLETKKQMLEQERVKLLEKLREIHPKLTLENLEVNINALEERIQRDLNSVEIPEEYKNDIAKLGG